MKFKSILIGLSLLGYLGANAQLIEEKIAHPSAVSGWITGGTNGTWTSDTSSFNGYWKYIRGKKSSNTTTSITLSSANLNVNPILVNANTGYIKVKFDLRLAKNGNNNPVLNVGTVIGTSTTNYLTFTKTGVNSVTTTTTNAGILSYGFSTLPNDSFRSVTLLIPRNTAFNGSLRFSFTPNSTSNTVDLRNISVTSLSTATPPNCSSCYFTLAQITNDTANFIAETPTPYCGQTQTTAKYKYYLPAIAKMPDSINTTQYNSVPPAQIQITTDSGIANFTITRPEGTFVANGIANSTSLYSRTTQLSEMLTDQYNTPYTSKGFIIESDQPITARWTLNNAANRMQVILRGQGALGNVFRLSSVLDATDTVLVNGVHYYTILATENNTKVQIGNPAIPSSITTFTLNKGQQRTGVSKSASMAGTLVVSDHPIVVASGQQHKRIMSGSTSLEGTVLQLSPIKNLGKEYISVNTEGYAGFQIVAVENATAVYRNNTLVTVLNAGEVHQVYARTATDSLYGKAARITTSKPAYVYELGSNNIGEFELYPAPPTDLPVGKAGRILYSQNHGLNGWVVVNTSDVAKLKRNNSATLNATNQWTVPALGSSPAKTIFYWNNNFSPLSLNNFTCLNCEAMYVGQMNDGGTEGAQVGYISSFDIAPIQFFNTQFLPTELLTNGYYYDTVKYYMPHASTLNHTVSLASSSGNVTIDSIALSRTSGNSDVGSVSSINGLNFSVNIPAETTVPIGERDTVNTTVYVVDAQGNKAALCLSYIITNINPLPIELLEFSARKEQKQAILDWTTIQDADGLGFIVLRSNDANNWSEIGTVEIATGTQTRKDYTFVDKTPMIGKNFYQLKQVNIDQTSSLSKIMALQFDAEKNTVQINPNPAQNNLNIKGIDGDYLIKIVDITGKTVLEQQVTNTASYNLDISHLNAGTFAIGLLTENGAWQFHKIQIVK